MLRQALKEALPHSEGSIKGRCKRLYQMLSQQEAYATLTELELHWGY